MDLRLRFCAAKVPLSGKSQVDFVTDTADHAGYSRFTSIGAHE